MRDQGRLIEWFDDKGYGFIQPSDSDKDRVFLHIKDFAQKGPRPILGCALEYVVQVDAQGRFKAKQVTYLTAKQVQSRPKQQRKQHTATSLKPMQIMSVIYVVGLALFVIVGWLSSWVLLFISLMNLVSYLRYKQDKQAAQQGGQRVPENQLHMLSFLGGWPAAWYAQEHLRHKTQKQPFRQIYFCTIVLNILFIFLLISPLKLFQF